MKNKLSLEEFSQESKFTDSLFREVFLKLITKYKDETERQHLIRAVVEMFQRKYPSEMREFDKIMQKKRELTSNKFASDKEGQQQRLLFKFPESLMNRFSLVVTDPPFLSQSNPMTQEEMDEWAWFIKNFPQFVVPRRI